MANYYSSKYLGAIIVAAYSYMALVPILQPPVIRLMTTKKERKIRMKYAPKSVSKTTKILFPILITVISGILAPKSVALIGFLMFGNLIRECGVLEQLSETAQKVLANLITLLLGLTVATKMQADLFLAPDTLLILGLGLAGFVLDTAGGVLVSKLVNLFLPEGKKVNPMIGAAGISAFPMSARIVHKMGQQEDDQNFLLMPRRGRQRLRTNCLRSGRRCASDIGAIKGERQSPNSSNHPLRPRRRITAQVVKFQKPKTTLHSAVLT